MIRLEKEKILYSSKIYSASEIIKYNKKRYKETKDKCDIENLGWFGTYEASQRYEDSKHLIRSWKIIKSIYLLKIDQNEEYFKNKFLNTKKKLIPLTSCVLSENVYKHSYINTMNVNERCLYEFKFAFGYMMICEQYEFIKLILYLIENKNLEIFSRSNESILIKLKARIFYYNLNFIKNKNQKYNRYSIYMIDKNVIRNVCKITYYDGIYQENITSFWYPFSENMEEYILFRPYNNLMPIEDIEKEIKERINKLLKINYKNIDHLNEIIDKIIKLVGNPFLKKSRQNDTLKISFSNKDLIEIKLK
jgi:hypothetical protein